MTLSVIDSAAGIRRVLDAAPDDRADLVREIWAPLAGMYHFIPGGLDMATVHRQNSGFDWDAAADTERTIRAGLDALVVADAWTRVGTALRDGIAALTAADPSLIVPDLQVLLMLGDPTNAHFMDEMQGLSAFGGISGYIAVTVWPDTRVLERLEAIVIHELHHNLRYAPGGVVWDPATVTVGEHVVSEGLADLFASELHGTAGLTHFVSAATRSDDEVLSRVATGLGVTGMADFASWVLGDASASLFGAEPVGLPTGAGYAAGARLVQAYLDETGATAAASLRTPAADILRVALPRLGLAEHAAD